MNETAWTSGRRTGWQTRNGPWMNRRSVTALVAVSLTWAFSLSGVQRHLFAGLPESVQAWARACPACGTVESVATLHAPAAPNEVPVPVYRLTIRMADGSLRRIAQSTPMPPGAQVLVEGGAVRPVSPSVAQRQ